MRFPSKHEIAVAVGVRIRELRRLRGLSQLQLAVLTGSHRPIVARWERGVHSLEIDTVNRIAAALGVSPALVLEPIDDLQESDAEEPTAGRSAA
jgi:transcriptional regulator with XRE-family HTH domain